MTYLSNRVKADRWKKSIIFSFISAAVIFFTYLRPPADPNYAGAMFEYNIGFFFPMLLLSAVLGLIAVINLFLFVRGLKDYEIRFKKLRIILTTVFLLPILLHVLILLLMIVRITFWTAG